MRLIVTLIVALLLIWTGVWFYAAHWIEREVTQLIETQRSDGWQVANNGVNVGGYPYRFDLSVDAPSVTSRNGAGWTAPRVDVQALAYQPTHVILTLPDSQTVTLPGQTIGVTSEKLQASIRTGLSADLPLRSATAQGSALGIASDAGWALRLSDAVLASRVSEDPAAGPFAHDIAISSSGLRPEGLLRDRMGSAEQVEGREGGITFDGTISLDRQIDRHSMEPRNLPEIQRLAIKRGEVNWGEAKLAISGTLDFGADGLANGPLSVEVSGWETILDMAISTGLIPEQQRSLVQTALRLLGGANLNASALKLPLNVQSGAVMLGPVPLTHLPPAVRH